MPNKDSDKLINVILFIFIFIAAIGSIGSFVINTTTDDTEIDTFTITSTTYPQNVTLSQSRIVSLTSVTNSTGLDLVASNYTDFATDGFLQLNANDSILDGEVNVRYTWNNGTLSGASAIMIGLTVLFLVIFFIGGIMDNQTKGRK